MVEHQAICNKDEVIILRTPHNIFIDMPKAYENQSSRKVLFSGKFDNMSNISFNGSALIFLNVSLLFGEQENVKMVCL